MEAAAAAEDISIEDTDCSPPDTTSNVATPESPPTEPQKMTKRDEKNIDQFMKSLNSITSMEEKLSLVCKKYVLTADHNKKMQFYIKQSEKRHTLLLKEKEHLQHEYNKTILVKSKLENLCRELQKQNKAIKEESLLKIREEEERRKETHVKFQNTLSEITALLQQNNEKNVKLRDDNISMSEKFKSVIQQYELREQQVDKMAKQMQLESQLADAKLQKAHLEHQAEKERLLADMEQLQVTAAQNKAKIVELQGIETALKSQLAIYTDKYDEFQNALMKSNQVFTGFKEQMEMMLKKIKKLEKESVSWKKRWETSQTALLDMCSERQLSEERVTATTRQLQHMQSLCRTLQAERTLLLNALKEHNIERPPVPAPIPAPPPQPILAPVPAKDAKMDAMVANCAQLRQSLAHLQTQLNVLTTNKNEIKEDSPKPEKQKKIKSKKSKSEKQALRTKTDKSEGEENNVNETSITEETSCVEQNTTTNENSQDITNEEDLQVKVEDDLSEDKLDEKTLESLIQAMNIANLNLADLESVGEEVSNKIDVVKDLSLAVEEIKAGASGSVPLEEIQLTEAVKTAVTIEEVVQSPEANQSQVQTLSEEES